MKKSTSRVYPDYPYLGVGAVVFNKDQILLIKRGQEPSFGKWTIPGGLIELGESLVDGVKREIFEECNIQIKVYKQIDIFEYIEHDDSNKIKYHYIIIDYLADYLEGNLTAKSDILEAKWCTKSEFSHLDVIDTTRQVVEKALKLKKTR
jgi:ADP-ribose pyrophosphatase YjhB (NUDIX family)